MADNGNTMATLAPSGERKQEIATFCAGVMSYIAIHHGDYIGIVYGNKAENNRFALKEDAAYAENFLSKYAKSTNIDAAPSDLNSLLSYVTKTYRERCFMMLITDADGISRVEPDLLRRLAMKSWLS